MPGSGERPGLCFSVADDALENAIHSITKLGKLTPRGIRTHLKLNQPIYAPTAAYGHFGRKPEGDFFPWEKTDLVDDLKAALDIAQKGGRDQKDERFAYLAASIHAVENRLEDAVQALAKAVELSPKNRIHAFHDADFAELRKNRDHRHLFGLT